MCTSLYPYCCNCKQFSFLSIAEHYESRLDTEPNVRSDMEPFVKQLKDVEQQMAEGKQKALEQMFPKFATVRLFKVLLCYSNRLDDEFHHGTRFELEGKPLLISNTVANRHCQM